MATKKAQWLLVGGETLLGKEICDQVEERKLPVVLRLASAQSGETVLAAAEDEIEVVEPLSAELLEDAAVVLLCGTADSSRQALALARGLERTPAFVDLSGALEDLADSVVRSPLVEPAAFQVQAGALHVPAHPAATGLARLLARLHEKWPLLSAVATVLQPASEYGKPGIDELHQQSINLFNFQNLPRDTFDAQVSFNLLPRYGDEAKVDLARTGLRVERHLASLLGPLGVPLPSVRVVHAPVFHAYCLNVWVEFAQTRPTADDAREALAEAGLEAPGAGADPVSNASVAGYSGLAVSDIVEDRNSGRALWVWTALDNLRTLADEALIVAGLLTRDRGAA